MHCDDTLEAVSLTCKEFNGILGNRWFRERIRCDRERCTFERRPDQKPRISLPIIINYKIIYSHPDSGSEDNIIALPCAKRLGLDIDTDYQHQKIFYLASRVVVRSLGRVTTLCTFSKDRGTKIMSSFYVFQTLLFEVVIGMAFLDLTETLTKHTCRLQKQPRQPGLPHLIPRVSALNYPRRGIQCVVYCKDILANADTGSEMNLISLCNALLRGLRQDIDVSGTQWKVQLADGRITQLVGKVDLTIRFGARGFTELTRTFYVIPDLTCHLLLGEEILEEIDAFQSYRDTLVIEENALGSSGVCTIVWLNSTKESISPVRQNGVNLPRTVSGNINRSP